MDPDGVTPDGIPVSCSLGRFGIDRIEELHQTPVLNHTLGHRNLQSTNDEVCCQIQLLCGTVSREQEIRSV